MAKYHINPATGNPNVCRAQAGGCPFASADNHYDTKEDARTAYEASMDGSVVSFAGGARMDAHQSKSRFGVFPNTRVGGWQVIDNDYSGPIVAGENSGVANFATLAQAQAFINSELEKDVKRLPTSEHIEDLIDSIRDYRASGTTAEEREIIREYWAEHNIANQFAAARRVSELKASEKSAPRQEVPAFTVRSDGLPELITKMERHGFFVNERHASEGLEELKAKEGEHWYSNGVVDFKIFHDRSLDGNHTYRFVNNRNLLHTSIKDIFTIEANE